MIQCTFKDRLRSFQISTTDILMTKISWVHGKNAVFSVLYVPTTLSLEEF